MAITKLGTALIVYERVLRLCKLAEDNDNILNQQNIFSKLTKDLKAKKFSDRYLGDMPEYIYGRTLNALKTKRKEKGLPQPVNGAGDYLEDKKYFLSKEQMRHLYERRMLKNRYTAERVADLLQDVLHGGNTQAEPSYRRKSHQDTIALYAPNDLPDEDIDMVFGVPINRRFEITTGYNTEAYKVPQKFKP